MYEYDGSPDHPLRHSPVELTEEDIVSMSTLLVNGKYEDCSIVGLSPFCKINPVPEVSISLFLCVLPSYQYLILIFLLVFTGQF